MIKKRKYGSQYKTVLKHGNIKFVKKNSRASETLKETMTSGRVYVTVGGDELQSITYFDKENKRVKQINLDHTHKGMKLHTHHGYFHNENDSLKGASKLSKEEKAMVERITKLWDNKKSK